MTSFISRTVRSAIGRNMFFLGISAAAKGISSIVFVLVAVGAMEPGESGQVILAFLAIRIAQNVAGVGFARYLARETANEPDNTAQTTDGVIKLLLAALPIGLAAGALALLAEPRLGLAIMFISIASVFGSAQQAVGGTFLGRGKTELDSAAETTAGVLLIVGALVAAVLERGPLAYVAVVAVSRFVAAIVALALFQWSLRPDLRLRAASATRAFREGFPYMLNAGSSFVFLRADIILLGLLSGTHAVSIYGGVADPLVTLGAGIHIVNTSFLPSLSSAEAERPRIAGRMLGLDLGIGLALAIALAVTAEPFAERFFDSGDSASVDVLRVLCVALVFRFVNNGLATWLTAAGLQWRRTVIAIAAGVFNVSVNLVAISLWGYWAAVWTTIATEALILALSAFALRSEIAVKEPQVETAEPAPEPIGGYNLGPE